MYMIGRAVIIYEPLEEIPTAQFSLRRMSGIVAVFEPSARLGFCRAVCRAPMEVDIISASILNRILSLVFPKLISVIHKV